MTYTEKWGNLDKLPSPIDKIIVSGLGRTDEALIKKQFRSLASSSNLTELFNNIRDAKDRLHKLNIFRYVNAVVDIADCPGKYNVIFQVEEKRPTTARIAATQGTDGTSKLCGTARLNNVFGGAEHVDLDLEIGTNQLTTKSATFSKPLESNPYVRFAIGGTDGRWDHYWAKFMRQEKSVFSEVQAKSPLGLHRFQWDAAWREIEAKDNSTLWSVRKESGSALKFGVRHSFEVDNRSDLVFPESGYLLRLTKELASITPGRPTGVNNSAATPAEDRALQLKVEGMALKPFRLADWLVAELTFSTGLAHSLTGHPIHIVDRFFLGGPLELRGFQWRSVGPTEPLLQPAPSNLQVVDTPEGQNVTSSQSDVPLSPIGSEAFWQSGAHVYTPLPYFGALEDSLASHFRLHGFYMMGNTLDSPVVRLSNCFSNASSFSSATQNLFNELGSKSRAVIGAGLVIRFAGVLRVEINYCLPIRSQPGDLTKPGFSFGLGMYYS